MAPPAPVPHYLQHGPPVRPRRNRLYIGLGAAALALVVLVPVGLVIGNFGSVFGGSP